MARLSWDLKTVQFYCMMSNVTSLCWHPDGKVIVLGLEDGTVLLHDFENGKLLRSLKSHMAAVVSQLGGGCLTE
ncbi:hypothetical protein NL676_007139 [Syzygium grande]|nr:hypothetical protein NL676_007139 [Syzygium grande]